MRVNGKNIPLKDSPNLYEFLKREGYIPKQVAVLKNDTIITKGTYEKEILSDTDQLEIVTFVGGG